MRYSNTKKTQALITGVLMTLGLGLALGRCGGGSSGGGSEQAISAITNPQLIGIPISVKEEQSSATGLMLAAPGGVAADSYVMTLASCASGLSGNNSTAGIINVYLYDTGCKARLASFVLHGQSYVPTGTGSVPFTTWLAGDTAVFVGASSTDLVNVKVVSQLSSPINVSDEVSYNFSIIKAGTNNSSLTVSTARTLYVAGQEPPNFKINTGDATFDDITGGGAGKFTFKLTCFQSAMTVGANVSYNSFCPTITPGGTIAGGAAGVDIGASNRFSYKLIADPNNNGTITLAQAQSAMSSGDSTVTLATDILAGNTGFTTNSITGPTTISANPKMILILQAKNTNPTYNTNTAYSSFQYFAITLPTVTP